MASDKPINVQNVFLNNVRKNKIPLTIFLVNGVKLQGVITWFDSFCLLLRREGHSQLVYKHAISTVMPQGSLCLFEQQSPPPSGASFSEEDNLENDLEDQDTAYGTIDDKLDPDGNSDEESDAP